MFQKTCRLVVALVVLFGGALPVTATEIMREAGEALDRAVYETAEADGNRQLEALRAAAELAEQAVEQRPDAAEAWVLLARARGEIARRSGIMQNLGVAPRLKEYFEKALELDSTNVDALTGYALWHLEIAEAGAGWLYGADRAEVLPLLAEAVRLAPDRLNVRVEYAAALLRLGQPEEAGRQLEAALALPATSEAELAERERVLALLESL